MTMNQSFSEFAITVLVDLIFVYSTYIILRFCLFVFMFHLISKVSKQFVVQLIFLVSIFL